MPRPIKQEKLVRPEYAQFAAHPFNSDKSHEEVLNYLKQRIASGMALRNTRLPRLRNIDKQVAGWVKKTHEEKEADRTKEDTGLQTPTNVNIPLVQQHIDDMVTYFMQIFAPISGMYNLAGSARQKQAGMALTKEMENNASHTGAFRQIRMACMAALKYNCATIHTYWDRESASVIDPNSEPLRSTRREVWAGNRIGYVDSYNAFWDPSVNPVDVHKHGEFCGVVDLVSSYQIERDTRAGIYTNTEKFLERDVKGKPMMQPKGYENYKHPPTEAQLGLESTDGVDESTDWFSFVGQGKDQYAKEELYERTVIYVRINPYAYYLVPGNQEMKQTRAEREIWRITILNGDTIVETRHMPNIHDWLPYNFLMPIDGDMGLDQRSAGEIADPFQVFVSFLYNMQVKANRKNVFGTTFYDPKAIDFDAVPAGEAAARVPIKAAGRGKDIRTLVYHDDNVLDTSQVTQTIDNAMGMLRDLLPLQADPAQIAGIDRAVKNQVSAVRQGSNRRIHGMARLMDIQAFRPSRVIQYYNLVQFRKEPINITVDGQTVAVAIAQLQELELEYVLGNGLQALDLEAIAEHLRDMVFMVLQSQEAAAQFDVPALMNALAANMNLDINLDEYRRAQPQPGESTQEGAPATGAVGQQA